ncbi:hypothetical protein C1645_816132 [Glomus cerebriforme]|uniref:CCHC-type domain-containing protein n=1 Tax=Glomus cerebriforme TaxID=658196 RepID=A0A397TES7_9GLOM|nr:hypothetical protein C1645_816132 [Glomus cerebriforme]
MTYNIKLNKDLSVRKLEGENYKSYNTLNREKMKILKTMLQDSRKCYELQEEKSTYLIKVYQYMQKPKNQYNIEELIGEMQKIAMMLKKLKGKVEGQGRNNERRDNFRCYNCGKRGHTIKFYRQRNNYNNIRNNTNVKNKKNEELRNISYFKRYYEDKDEYNSEDYEYEELYNAELLAGKRRREKEENYGDNI